jgi:two-component system KDP operon response regulator KdpE
VLVIEDDLNIVDLVRSNLSARGYEIEVSTTGRDVVSLVESHEPDIVLLDLMLPAVDGFDLCRDIRQHSSVGMIVVSARTGEQDKVRALNLGADDYLTKPFGIDELLARMTATLRRSRPVEEPSAVSEIQLGEILIDLDASAVVRSGERVQLTPTEFSLLKVLATNAGRLLSYEQLLREVWGTGYESSREYVRVYVGRLRAKLEDPDGPPLIITEPRAGYRLVRPGD